MWKVGLVDHTCSKILEPWMIYGVLGCHCRWDPWNPFPTCPRNILHSRFMFTFYMLIEYIWNGLWYQELVVTLGFCSLIWNPCLLLCLCHGNAVYQQLPTFWRPQTTTPALWSIADHQVQKTWWWHYYNNIITPMPMAPKLAQLQANWSQGRAGALSSLVPRLAWIGANQSLRRVEMPMQMQQLTHWALLDFWVTEPAGLQTPNLLLQTTHRDLVLCMKAWDHPELPHSLRSVECPMNLTSLLSRMELTRQSNLDEAGTRLCIDLQVSGCFAGFLRQDNLHFATCNEPVEAFEIDCQKNKMMGHLLWTSIILPQLGTLSFFFSEL